MVKISLFHAKGLIFFLIDNSGCFFVVYSGTKYLCGHNDIIAGFLVVSEADSEYARKLELCIKSEGPNLSPMDSWLMLRSIKTLGLRVECQAARALEIARWLQAQQAVEEVYYVGLSEHPGYALHQSQASGSGSGIAVSANCRAYDYLYVSQQNVQSGRAAGFQYFYPKQQPAPPVLSERSASGYSQPNTLGLFATEAAYKDGAGWLSALLGYLEENIRRTREFLERELPEIRLIEPEGTYLLWLDCSAAGLTAEQLDRAIVEKGNLWLDSGRIFGHAGEGFQRINMACPWSVLENGLEHLKLALRAR